MVKFKQGDIVKLLYGGMGHPLNGFQNSKNYKVETKYMDFLTVKILKEYAL